LFIYFQNTNRRLSNNIAPLTIAYAVYGLLCSAVFVVVLALLRSKIACMLLRIQISCIFIFTKVRRKRKDAPVSTAMLTALALCFVVCIIRRIDLLHCCVSYVDVMRRNVGRVVARNIFT
jgi:hypothetical protein